jgi:hypothetical protein
MTPQERQEFFNKEGYWPMDALIIRPPKLSKRDLAKQAAGKLLTASRGAFLRGWRAPLHWIEPPLFQNPGFMYEELGHEEFLRQVSEYYEGISQLHCEKAYRQHARWAVKQILRNFETHVRGFRGQSVGRRGGIFPKASGQEKWGPDFRPHYEDILTLPESIGKEDGRLVNDIAGHLRAYAVPEDQIEALAAEVRLRLESIWGIKL